MSAGSRTDAIELWRAAELFAPQPLSRGPDVRAWSVEESSPFPWDASHGLRLEPLGERLRWQHAVLCGVYSIDEVLDEVRRRNPAGERMPDERRTDDESALAAFVVADDGRPLLDSPVLASCAWAVSQTLREGLGSVATGSFARLAAAFRLECEELLAADDDDEQAKTLHAQGHRVGAPIDWETLQACSGLARRLLELDELDASDPLRNAHEIRIVSYPVSARSAHSAGEREILNSFYAEDLRRVRQAIESDAYGKALREYLTPAHRIDAARRIDVEDDLSYVRKATSAGRIPAGRWPSSAAHTAGLGQQLALNTILSEKSQRLFAVNGPPGTGKTAMLRDLLAAVVVQRAIELAKLEHPKQAFREDKLLRWGTNGRHPVYELRPELTGFELVLACATNSAAENVSAEIPGVDAIDERWAGRTDYFADVATSMLNGRRRRDHGHQGRRDSESEGDGHGYRQAWAMVSAVLGKHSNNKRFVERFWFDGLRPSLREHQEVGTWQFAVEEFRKAHKRVHEMQQERSTYDHLFEQLQTAREELQRASAHADRLQSELAALDRRLSLLRRRGKLTRQARAHEARLHAAQQRVLQIERDIADARALCARRFPAMAFPDAHWARPGGREQRERQAPWLEESFDAARSELFLAALELHKAFVQGAHRQMQASLTCATELINGRASSGVSEAAAKAAWQCLFMVVPLVSTTFASFPYLFRHLNEQAIGWLLVDEAGQATPQMAIGALWRSIRAVVVGDPLQLEPISTLPVSIKNALRHEHGIDSDWLPNGASVQTLTDQVAPAGTYRGDGTRKVWVGTPLNVHRRCEAPMFEIVNEVAYENQMINCTPPRPGLELPASHWIDVPDAPSNGNWVSAEGEALRELLDGLRFHMVDFTEVFAITPFRDVADRITDHRRTFRGLRTGTIHTAQGREADIVVLILGGNSEHLGARSWAAEKPNLLNVAVSRARRRLYVIGDRDSWALLPHFKTLAASLETVAWTGHRGETGAAAPLAR